MTIVNHRGGLCRVRLPVCLVAGAAVLGTTSLCASVISVGLFLSRPAIHDIGAPPPDLAVENVSMKSTSEATLRGWFVPGKRGGGAVVLMHGVRADRLSMLSRARILHAAGFGVLLFDFQAHGESTGKRITFGRLEALDADAAVAFVRHRLPDEKVGAIGTSLGGAAALLGPKPLGIDALVLEAVYPDIAAATTNRIRSVLGPKIGPFVAVPLTRLLELLMPPLLGVTPRNRRPIDHIAEIGAPVLIASGIRDSRTPADETLAMYDRAREPKSLWLVQGAEHVDLEHYEPDGYRKHVLAFLVDTLQQR